MYFFWLAVCSCTFGVFLQAQGQPDTGALIVTDNNVVHESRVDDDDTTGTGEVFLPTHEWQTVKPGQGIPRGLHVRMNLQTRQKEAKLLDSDSTTQTQRADALSYHKHTVKELKDALRLLPADNPGTANDEVQNRFRSIKDIKEEFNSLNIKIVTEEQIIEELLTKLSEENISFKQEADILLELEYYVHKYDNAVEFARLGGIQKAISSLNSTDEDLRTASAFLLGTAMQSNPKVQVLAMDSGATQALIHHLAADTSRSVQIKCLYALSCMIRQFPFAQKTLTALQFTPNNRQFLTTKMEQVNKVSSTTQTPTTFVELGGLSVLGGFFSKTGTDVEKLQIKSVALLYDTIMEYKLAHEHSSSVEQSTSGKLLQYAQVNIKEAIKQFELCPHIPRLLSVTDHDTREKVVMLMSVLVDNCWKSFLEWTSHIQSLQQQYHALALRENEDEDTSYFSKIRDTIQDILTSLRRLSIEHGEL